MDRVAKVRYEIASCLGRMAETLKQAEPEEKNTPGGLGLETEIEDINIASQNLRSSVFRLLVLGDMKRGKSTFFNALIGENLLPSDVNPCTALLTVLRFGTEKKVTVYFNNGNRPEQLDFTTFKYRYTIDPAEAKKLEQEKQQAFPDVDYAVVEYPLPLLEKGIEIVDSPGLNDTEARNELSLGYINNCHAIFFVLRASQPCTLGERRYLENYIKGRGLSVFFLINAWDQIRDGLIDPDDPVELQEAEDKLRRVFKANLDEYCQVDGHDVYDERVFEISAIKALRRRVKNSSASLEGTGFPEFMGALNTFLTKERAIAELRQARTLARQASTRTREAIARRIPLLDQDVDQLKLSNLYRVDALPALRTRLKGDVSAAHSTGLTMFGSALQNIVTVQQEKLAVRFPRVLAIATQVKQDLLSKAQAIAIELSAVEQKRNAKIQIKQKAEKLIKQGFQSSIFNFQSWLYLPKLLECYQSEIASALQQGEFKTWETGKFKQAILEHQQAVVKWVHQACEFFNRPQPADLWISFPDEPEVFLPNQPSTINQSSSADSVGIVTELSQFLVETIGAVVVGGATYLFSQDTDEEKPESSASYLNQVSQAYADAATDYLIRFNTQALSTLCQYEKIAEKVITFQVTEEPLEITSQHHQLQLLHTVLDNLNQELESVSAR